MQRNKSKLLVQLSTAFCSCDYVPGKIALKESFWLTVSELSFHGHLGTPWRGHPSEGEHQLENKQGKKAAHLQWPGSRARVATVQKPGWGWSGSFQRHGSNYLLSPARSYSIMSNDHPLAAYRVMDLWVEQPIPNTKVLVTQSPLKSRLNMNALNTTDHTYFRPNCDIGPTSSGIFSLCLIIVLSEQQSHLLITSTWEEEFSRTCSLEALWAECVLPLFQLSQRLTI